MGQCVFLDCAGAIFQPTDVQSYYFSYGTSFNPSLETLTLTSGQQSLDPETGKQFANAYLQLSALTLAPLAVRRLAPVPSGFANRTR